MNLCLGLAESPSAGQNVGNALGQHLEAPVVVEGLPLTMAAVQRTSRRLAVAADQPALRARAENRSNLLAAVAVQLRRQALVLLQAAVEAKCSKVDATVYEWENKWLIDECGARGYSAGGNNSWRSWEKKYLCIALP